MNLLMSDSVRCAVAPDGTLWSPSPTVGYDFWKNYVGIFDEVYALVRARHVDEPPAGWARLCGPGVRGMALPYFIGPWQLAASYRAVNQTIREALRRCQAINLRLPSTISQLVWAALGRGRPYGVTVTGDPDQALAPGMLRDPALPLFRRLYTRRLGRQCARARAVTYVTREYLQRKYPAPAGIFSTHYTDAVLPEEIFQSEPRPIRPAGGPFRVVLVGSLAHLIKGVDVLIDAAAICVRAGIDMYATIVGDGRYRPVMAARCQEAGLQDRISFKGQLSSAAEVVGELDQADLFVLPSWTEGLPRAMIEAMARAVPCIGTAVGGIPELLPAEDLIPPGDAAVLAQRIQEVSGDPERLARMSARNLEAARQYESGITRARREEYLRVLRQETAGWLRQS